MLANEIENPAQKGLGAMDITVRRNAYGRQIDSFIAPSAAEAAVEAGGGPIEMVFIRAPKIAKVGPNVEVLARQGDDPVLVRQGHTLAATFHPELSDDPRVHAYFLKLVSNGQARSS